MVADEHFQCSLCGVRLGRGANCHSLVRHWRAYHAKSNASPKPNIAQGQERYMGFLAYVSQKHRRREQLGFRNEALINRMRYFFKMNSAFHTNQNNTKGTSDAAHRFSQFLSHCENKKATKSAALKKRNAVINGVASKSPASTLDLKKSNAVDRKDSAADEENQCNKKETFSGNISNAPSKLHLQCKFCDKKFTSVFEAVYHHEKQHKPKNYSGGVTEENTVESTEDKTADNASNISDAPKDGVRVKEETETLKKETNNNESIRVEEVQDKRRFDDTEVIVIPDDDSDCEIIQYSSSEEKDPNSEMGKSPEFAPQNRPSECETIDLTNEKPSAIEEILLHRDIIAQFLSRKEPNKKKSVPSEHRPSIFEQFQVSNFEKVHEESKKKPAPLTQQNAKPTSESKKDRKRKGAFPEKEKRKRSRDDSHAQKEKKAKMKQSEKGNARDSAKQVHSTVEQVKALTTNNNNTLHCNGKALHKEPFSPKSSRSPWEDLIWNSTKDPLYSKERDSAASNSDVNKPTASKPADVDPVTPPRPKLTRKQSARKSCKSKESNEVPTLTSEEESEWPFTPQTFDCIDDDVFTNPEDDTSHIWRLAVQSVQGRVEFPRSLASTTNLSRRFVHKKVSKYGSPFPEPAEAGYPPAAIPEVGAVRKRRQTARKSTRSRPSHLSTQESLNRVIEAVQQGTCECHVCGKIVSSATDDLYAHYRDCHAT